MNLTDHLRTPTNAPLVEDVVDVLGDGFPCCATNELTTQLDRGTPSKKPLMGWT